MSVPVLPEVTQFLAEPPAHRIAGAVAAARAEGHQSVINPATGDEVAKSAIATTTEVDDAVAAALAAHCDGRWHKQTAARKAALLRRIADGVEDQSEMLAQLDSIDCGKPIRQSRGEVASAVEAFRYFSAAIEQPSGELIDVGSGLDVHTRREPVGVCAAITPWNYPLLMAAWKVAPALAFGNTVVLKPAEQTSLSALRLADICAEAGLPDGALNVVTGAGETGAALVRNARVDKVAFTGSTPVGRQIAAIAGGRLARSTLELGGKSANIVYDSADLDAAATGTMWGIFRNSGQMCTAGSRIFVQRRVHDAFMELFLSRVAALRLGDPMDEKTQLGPLVSREQQAMVLRYVRSGIDDGAAVIHGGTTNDGPGFFVEPTVFDAVAPKMTIAQEEIFGPVGVIIPFDKEADAVALANDSIYGLAATVWTENLKTARRAAEQLRAGTVWVNTTGRFSASVPFGGMKQSGIGRELGAAAIDAYTERKSVWTQT